MAKKRASEKWEGKAAAVTLLLALLAALILAKQAAAPQMPHSIAGYIFESDFTTQVPVGTNFSINDTNSGDFLRSSTNIPVPELTGRYFETINGSDGDTVIIRAWNTSHYGETTVTLLGDMDDVNVAVNMTRAPETNISILLPANGTLVNMSLYFNVTAMTGMVAGGGTGCNATISFNDTDILSVAPTDSALRQLGDIALGNPINTTWNVSAAKSGKAIIRVESGCGNTNITFEGLYHNSINITVNDTVLPNITLKSPANNSWNRNNVTFVYNASDASGIRNCSIYIDSGLNLTNATVQSGLLSNFTVQNMSEGSHAWLIGCYDNSTSLNPANSTAFTVNIDTTPPNITLLSPLNNSVSDNNTVIFNYNVTENFVLANCSLLLNGATSQTNGSAVLRNTTQNFTATLAKGNYTWTVNCTDAAENSGAAARSINITDADLTLNSSDIAFSTETPVEGQEVTINVTIRNIGDENATNFTVQIFENEPGTGASQIGQNFTLNLSANNSTSTNVSWTAKPGLYNITVLLDVPLATGGFVNESNETNNRANSTLSIPVWHLYYGTITSDIVLATASNLTVFRWAGATNLSQNLYAADSDSSINWSGLQALGRNASGNASVNDFEEADAALNLSGYTDSINMTFTANGAPKNLTNFTVFGYMVYNVSTALSTNNSNFTTGILWDTSDSDSKEYNASNDLVFVAKVNANAQGSYGKYDYEIRVPASLRGYLLPNNLDTITFYTELT